MESHTLQFGAAALAIPMAGAVIFCTKWLIAAEKKYPRESFPVTKSDRRRGVLVGVLIAVAWVAGDLFIKGLRAGGDWDLLAWEFRFVMSTLFVLAGRLTCAQIFRLLRCRKEFPH
jgi:drug/metabolite transporter (DMT)-like permease